MNILIVGDSFCADWSIKNASHPGWWQLLSEKHNIDNRAQAGVSQYKVYKQLTTANLSEYDLIIASNTSPYRVPTIEHPVHKEGLHKDADLIFSDIEHFANLDTSNPATAAAYGYFIHHFSPDYFIISYRLLRREIYRILCESSVPFLFLDFFAGLPHDESENVIPLYDIVEKNPGNVNHMNAEGNFEVFKIISNIIDQKG